MHFGINWIAEKHLQAIGNVNEFDPNSYVDLKQVIECIEQRVVDRYINVIH